MYLPVISVTPIDNYKILLTFGNGEKRQFDMNPIEWENEADIAPKSFTNTAKRLKNKFA